MTLWIGAESYDDDAKRWLGRSGHYLDNPPPGCILCVVVRDGGGRDLFGDVAASGPRLGLCLIGRPIARALPQDGSWGEITRFVLADGLPYATASSVLLRAIEQLRARRIMTTLIAYHDRTRHTGCIYRKAGFRKDGVTAAKSHAWGSRPGRKSSELPGTPKRRWLLTL